MKGRHTFGLFLFAALLGVMSWFVPREQFLILIGLYGFSFGLYFWLSFQNISDQVIFWLGVFLRVLVLFSLPQLSNDVYRFVWDGRLLVAGENPFALRPSEWMSMTNSPLGIDQELHQLIYADNYTVYPPIHQAIFWMSAKFTSSIFGSIIILKSILVAGEITLLWFLRKLKKIGRWKNFFVLYALNPLVILEIAGNGHFEGLMILFLVLGVYGLRQKDWKWTGIGFGLAIATKLLPLMLLPLVWQYIGRPEKGKKNGRLIFLMWVVIINLVLWFPFYWMGSLHHLMDSVWLYFESFEFNASIFYLLKWLAPSGWRIGLITNALTIGLILYLTFRQKTFDFRQFIRNSALIWGVYLLDSAIVHPWYVIPFFVLGVMANRGVAVLWTGLIYLSYSHYWNGAMQEQYGLIAFEYILLGVGAWLLRRQSAKDFFEQITNRLK